MVQVHFLTEDLLVEAPAGTGLAYHTQRRRNAAGLTEAEMATLSGEAAEEAATTDEAAAE